MSRGSLRFLYVFYGAAFSLEKRIIVVYIFLVAAFILNKKITVVYVLLGAAFPLDKRIIEACVIFRGSLPIGQEDWEGGEPQEPHPTRKITARGQSLQPVFLLYVIEREIY
jgi:hypothetical protein